MERKAASSTTSILLFMSMLTLAFSIQPVKTSETIHIRADGSIEGTADISSADNITYTFTANIYDSIVVERDNIVVDGAGYTLQGTGAQDSIGIYLSERNNVSIRNTKVREFLHGIFLSNSSGNTLSENSLLKNTADGICLWNSSRNTVVGNTISNNTWGISLGSSASNNMLSDNIVSSNSRNGFWLDHSNNNHILGNNVSLNGFRGYEAGIKLDESHNNTVSQNRVSNNYNGIGLHYSSQNAVASNEISKTKWYGIWLYRCSEEKIFHNNFLNNTYNVKNPYLSECLWDNGYPSGGNYWSDYRGTDADEDGIGDTPYVIDENNQDPYPLMTPYVGTAPPAGQEAEPFPTLIVAIVVAIAVVGAVVIIYFMKFKK